MHSSELCVSLGFLLCCFQQPGEFLHAFHCLASMTKRVVTCGISLPFPNGERGSCIQFTAITYLLLSDRSDLQSFVITIVDLYFLEQQYWIKEDSYICFIPYFYLQLKIFFSFLVFNLIPFQVLKLVSYFIFNITSVWK